MKKYIKMNDNNNYLSLGNVFNIIKSEASDKATAMQGEIFCSLFGIDAINSTTVNNYCVGARAIGIEYKRIFIDKKEKFKTDKYVFIKNVLAIISILDERVYVMDVNSLDLINNNKRLKNICVSLYDIACRDLHINKEFLVLNKELLDNSNFYECFINFVLYAVLDNHQPIYIQDLKLNINKEELDEYLKIKLFEGVSYINSLIELALKNNVYACAELGAMEFDGLVSGVNDYNKSFKYYLKAANKDHPKACWMIANLILTKKVYGDFDTLWKYLNKSIELGSSAGLNTMGICYKYGITPEKNIDLEKAKYYFTLASNDGYVFAFNNLGLLCDNESDAINYFKISADMGESWALNRVGEYYRKQGDLDTAFIYYKKAIEAPIKEKNKWGYFNLAEYYYKDKDIKKYNEYMKIFNNN